MREITVRIWNRKHSGKLTQKQRNEKIVLCIGRSWNGFAAAFVQEAPSLRIGSHDFTNWKIVRSQQKQKKCNCNRFPLDWERKLWKFMQSPRLWMAECWFMIFPTNFHAMPESALLGKMVPESLRWSRCSADKSRRIMVLLNSVIQYALAIFLKSVKAWIPTSESLITFGKLQSEFKHRTARLLRRQCWSDSFLLQNYSGIELKSCLAVNGNGFIFWKCWWLPQMCCCWTSRPMIWILQHLLFWRTISAVFKGLFLRFLMTGIS